MDITRHDRRRRLLLVLLVITSLALVSLDERGSGIINSARTAAQDVMSPIQSLADDVFNPASDWIDGLGRANELQDQNEELQRQLDAALAQVAAGKADAVELGNLRAIADLPDIADGDAVTAQVIGQGPGNFARSLRISKGTSSGIAMHHAGRRRIARREGRRVGRYRRARVRERRRSCSASTTRTFGVGAQLMKPDKPGPPGTAVGQRSSNLLLFSMIDNSPTALTPAKGDSRSRSAATSAPATRAVW